MIVLGELDDEDEEGWVMAYPWSCLAARPHQL